jgi:hypothetical protein
VDDAKSVRRPNGAIIVDGKQVADTMQCCHCGGHFVVVKGSGTKRGFCLACGKVTCGAPACDEHIPFEKKLDQFERGKRGSL